MKIWYRSRSDQDLGLDQSRSSSIWYRSRSKYGCGPAHRARGRRRSWRRGGGESARSAAVLAAETSRPCSGRTTPARSCPRRQHVHPIQSMMRQSQSMMRQSQSIGARVHRWVAAPPGQYVKGRYRAASDGVCCLQMRPMMGVDAMKVGVRRRRRTTPTRMTRMVWRCRQRHARERDGRSPEIMRVKPTCVSVVARGCRTIRTESTPARVMRTAASVPTRIA